MAEKYLGHYVCPWCQHKFNKKFGKIFNEKYNKSGGGCSAVKCPKCDHNLKPEKDAYKIEDYKRKVFQK